MILTPGNTDDRFFQTVALHCLAKCLRFLGYVSQKLAQQLLNTAGIQLITFPQTQHETAIDVARLFMSVNYEKSAAIS